MGGRGRGNTFTQEQMQKLGVGAGSIDIPQVTNIPPPLFPPLTSAPISVKRQNNFQILWKNQFDAAMKDSPYHLNKTTYDYRPARNPQSLAALFDWKRFPSELRPSSTQKRKARSKPLSAKKSKTENIEARLKVLEEKERTGEGGKWTAKDDSDSDEEFEDEEAARDEEMDEENDYGNSYFDNGESYNDEDDNLDDGPVY